MEKAWTRSTARGPQAAPVHSGPRIGPQQWLTRGRLKRRTSAWNLTTSEEKEGGDGGDPHRLQKGAVEG
jgi:hypothetical protein